MTRRKVLLIGWDAADWRIIQPLLDAGKMPALARLLGEGVRGNLASINPPLSPMLWTSIATGKRPFKHGIHGFSEVDPNTGLVRPVTNLSRCSRAIWNLLQLRGLQSVVVGWWPSHPAEPISGAMVSNRFQVATGRGGDGEWPVLQGAVHPVELESRLQSLRIHPQHLDETHLLPFVPRAAEIDQGSDRRLSELARIIAEVSTVHAVATDLLSTQSWDFGAVYFDAIDHLCHGFIKFHPPMRPGVPGREFELYQHVVEGIYRYHDMMLETLLHLAGEETTVILVSDHGFHSGELRPEEIPLEATGPTAEHRRHGIFAIRGPGIRRGTTVEGAGILDICPTILTLFGLPVGSDMDGKPIHDLFEIPPTVESIPTWETLQGEDGGHSPGAALGAGDAEAARAALEQLVALGYIEPPDADARAASEKTERELRYNLAQSYMDAGRYGEAEALLEPLSTQWPEDLRLGMRLVACYHAIGRTERVRRQSRKMVREALRRARRAKQTLEKGGSAPPSPHLLADAHPNRDALRHFLAFADFAERRYDRALAKIRATSPKYRSRPEVLNTEGEILLRLREWDAAERLFAEILALDTDNAGAYRGIARARLFRRDFEGAVEAALASIRLVFSQPMAHYLLGMAWFRMGEIEKSASAFHATLRHNPTHPAAYRMLSEIASRYQGNAAAGAAYAALGQKARRKLKEFKNREEEDSKVTPALRAEGSRRPLPLSDGALPCPPEGVITIVTGLPRSGTSMMMQMLAAAGFSPFTDSSRPADASNPHGYFEHEAVKRLARDATWLAQARGKTLKVVVPLLPSLPAVDSEGKPLHYRAIFMHRPMNEILASQTRMLGEAKGSPADLEKVYRSQLAKARVFLAARRIPTLEIEYPEVCADPRSTAERITAFMGVGDVLAMTRAVL